MAPKNVGYISQKEMHTALQVHMNWLVVATQLKNISQIGSFPQVGAKIKDIWNQNLVLIIHPFLEENHDFQPAGTISVIQSNSFASFEASPKLQKDLFLHICHKLCMIS